MANLHTDYIDGYPAETGEFVMNVDEFSAYTRHENLLSAMGVPQTDLADSGGDVTLVARLGSGIYLNETTKNYHQWKGYRLDCGCLRYECGTEPEQANSCSLDFFRSEDGNYDWNCDRVEFDRTMVLPEKVGTCSTLLDGEIPDMFISNLISPTPTGALDYVDDYNRIYRVEWVTDGYRIDIITETFDPRVPGEEQSGYRDGLKIYRKGVTTITRQIIFAEDNGYVIAAEGGEQFVEYRQTNYTCPNNKPDDPFAHHVDCSVSDEVDLIVTSGPRWVDPDTETTDPDSAWADPDTSTGAGTFEWIDVWS